MDPMLILGQIFEATMNDLRYFESTVKSIIKEFAANALQQQQQQQSGSMKSPGITSTQTVELLQKYRQTNLVFLMKLLNQMTVLNMLDPGALPSPCPSCGSSNSKSPSPLLPTASATLPLQLAAVAAAQNTPGALAFSPALASLFGPLSAAVAAASNSSTATTTPPDETAGHNETDCDNNGDELEQQDAEERANNHNQLMAAAAAATQPTAATLITQQGLGLGGVSAANAAAFSAAIQQAMKHKLTSNIQTDEPLDMSSAGQVGTKMARSSLSANSNNAPISSGSTGSTSTSTSTDNANYMNSRFAVDTLSRFASAAAQQQAASSSGLALLACAAADKPAAGGMSSNVFNRPVANKNNGPVFPGIKSEGHIGPASSPAMINLPPNGLSTTSLSSQSRRSSMPVTQPLALLTTPGSTSTSHHHSHRRGSGLACGVRTADRYRVVYSSEQTFELEQEYRQNKFITITRKKELARHLGLNERQVKIWFQNRRAKDKRAKRRASEQTNGSSIGEDKEQDLGGSSSGQGMATPSGGITGSSRTLPLYPSSSDVSMVATVGGVAGASCSSTHSNGDDVDLDEDDEDDVEEEEEEEEQSSVGNSSGQPREETPTALTSTSLTVAYGGSTAEQPDDSMANDDEVGDRQDAVREEPGADDNGFEAEPMEMKVDVQQQRLLQFAAAAANSGKPASPFQLPNGGSISMAAAAALLMQRSGSNNAASNTPRAAFGTSAVGPNTPAMETTFG